MADNPRIEELRRRVQKDPASIAFAQLAEEFRRAGEYDEAVRVCRTGLANHPSYLSARVTLGRALIELEQFDEAQTELDYVLRSAPENLAAIRGLAEIHQRRGNLQEALRHFQAALGIAKHDPDLEESVEALTRQLGPDQTRVEPPPLPLDLPEFGQPAPPASAVSTDQPGPETSAELEAAADEFTKALQALDALSIDLPGPAAAAVASAPPPAPGPEDRRIVPAQEWETEGFDAAWARRNDPARDAPPPVPDAPPVLEAPVPAPAPSRPDAAEQAAVNELEAWLDAIVIDRDKKPS